MTDTQSRNRDWLERMLKIRFFEERVQELFMEGRVEGTTHLCQGQEAVSVGAVAAMRDDDYLTITYRGHGQALARGLSMESCFAELMGRSTGCCKGVGGSMHFTDLDRGLLAGSQSSGPACRSPSALRILPSSRVRIGWRSPSSETGQRTSGRSTRR